MTTSGKRNKTQSLKKPLILLQEAKFNNDYKEFESLFHGEVYVDFLGEFSDRYLSYQSGSRKYMILIKDGEDELKYFYSLLLRRRMDGSLPALLEIGEDILKNFDPQFHRTHGPALLRLSKKYRIS